MAYLRLLSWNVNGLNNKTKRIKIEHVILKKNLDIVCLQATHVVKKHRKILINPKMGVEFITSDKIKKRGVVLYIRSKFQPEFLFKDEEGRNANYVTGWKDNHSWNLYAKWKVNRILYKFRMEIAINLF